MFFKEKEYCKGKSISCLSEWILFWDYPIFNFETTFLCPIINTCPIQYIFQIHCLMLSIEIAFPSAVSTLLMKDILFSPIFAYFAAIDKCFLLLLL